MSNETDDEVDFPGLDRAIEVSVGDLIVVDDYFFRCTSLMINHDEPPTVIFDSIVHEMKKPASDTVRDKIDEGLLTPSELMARVLGGLFPYPNKEILCYTCRKNKKDLIGYWCHRCNNCIEHCVCEDRMGK